MRHLPTVTLAVLMGVTGLVLAESPSVAITSAKPAADSSCRNVSDLKGRVHSYCGSAAKWAEFDSQMAKLDKDFSCHQVSGSQVLCLFARQWEHVDRMYGQQQNAIVNSNGAGAETGKLSSMSIDSNPVLPHIDP
jgi:hypothetical protein